MGVMPEKEGEMPKEYIGRAPQEHGSIKVAWGKDCSTVQISVAGPVGWRLEMLDALPGYVPAEVDYDNGLDWHFTVSHRAEINDLIRALRKARDQALGKDE
ncbi:hypothetical protein LITTLEE_186 [Mycobacterium phage LittleE]|uniref:Uncharacterized protein n=1 Tax=Mycobacterium phage LittleE TaxID=2922212 RepID=G1D471_9CAUD|nr:hypothetical protein FGG27_gp186 [Mycobacterium phage LittleE]AEK09565.1 hypothetical protein LITTLEE_186 [Mycobacterium phage LittleE]